MLRNRRPATALPPRASTRCGAATCSRKIRAPSPPANAISAAATARPPSLRSWQARTRSQLNRPMQRRERRFRQRRIDLAAHGRRRALRPGRSASRPVRLSSRRPDTAHCRRTFRSIVTAATTSSICPIALINSDGGMAIVCRCAGGIGVAKFVVQAVLAADERRAQGDRQVVAGQRRADQRAERLRPRRYRPSRNCRAWRSAPDRRRRPRNCAALRRSRWRPCDRGRNRRSAGSCRSRPPARAASQAPAAPPPHRSGPSFGTPTSGLTTLPPCTS